ncbi:MAG: GGDEF and EAL domain-containing protein [Chloroflexi bacterium]|nr:MAG: GGDEF and EAL domain-containing protein [Chloroflexota bacterium]
MASALALGCVLALSALLFPQRGVALTWFVPVVDALVIATLVVAATLGYADALSRRHSRALPIANACLGSAVLWVSPMLTFPGVLPGGPATTTPLGTGLAFHLAHIGTPALVLWALLQQGHPVSRPRRTVLGAGAAAALGAGAIAAIPYTIGAWLGVHATTAGVGDRILFSVALIPGLIAVQRILAHSFPDERSLGGTIAALIFLTAEALAAPWVETTYSPAWYVLTMVRWLPACALLLGQLTLYRHSVAAELDSRRAENDRVRELTLMQEAAEALSVSLDRQAILQTAARYAAEIVPDVGARAQILEVRNGRCTVVAEHDNGGGASRMGKTFRLAPTATLRTLLGNGTAISAPLIGTGYDASMRKAGYAVAAYAPLRSGVLMAGVLALCVPDEDVVSAAGVRMLSGVAHLASLALANADNYGRLQAIATRDHLTGLANRREIDQRLEAVAGLPVAVLAIDVDNLKVINDTYGHEAGDATLRSVADVLRDGLREGDVAARTGGDEFVALLPGAGQAEAVAVAERLCAVMQGVPTPNGLGSISIGCAWTEGDEHPKSVWDAADLALYDAKRAGRNCVRFPDQATSDARTEILQWDTLLEEMLLTRQVVAVFQPVVRLYDGAAFGYEALARPANSDPDTSVERLFAAAQRLGLSPHLDWLCRRVALQPSNRLPADTLLFLNVGVSALLDPLHDIDQMMLLLRWSGRRAEDIVLEITEREAVRDVSRLETVVAAYRAEGFRFALDDVGEGHSTFELLAAAAPEFIKISSRLVRRHHVPAARSVIRGIVAFAAASGSEPIAEGIEGNEELEAMAELGVCLGQGYALGRPVNAADLPAELLAPLTWRLSLRSVAGHLSSSLSA